MHTISIRSWWITLGGSWSYGQRSCPVVGSEVDHEGALGKDGRVGGWAGGWGRILKWGGPYRTLGAFLSREVNRQVVSALMGIFGLCEASKKYSLGNSRGMPAHAKVAAPQVT